jgi:hypothetical protein
MDKLRDLSREVPDGNYSGKWKRYDVEFTVDDETVTAKCEAGLTNDYWEFCMVYVRNGKAVVNHAM